VFAKDAYINMRLLCSAMDLGFDVMEQVLRDEIRETERVVEWTRDVRNVELADKFQLDARGAAENDQQREGVQVPSHSVGKPRGKWDVR
jgi:hypothetical protein